MTIQNATYVQAPVTLVTTSETVAAALSLDEYALDVGGGVLVAGFVNITAGAAATGVQIRIRQGNSVAGIQIGQTDTHTLAAGASASIPVEALFVGATSLPPGEQFCVTVQQIAATGNGTVNDGVLTFDNVALAG